jgi:hypothetical protein
MDMHLLTPVTARSPFWEGQPSIPDGPWSGEFSVGQMSGQWVSQENPASVGPSNTCASLSIETRAVVCEPAGTVK